MNPTHDRETASVFLFSAVTYERTLKLFNFALTHQLHSKAQSVECLILNPEVAGRS